MEAAPAPGCKSRAGLEARKLARAAVQDALGSPRPFGSRESDLTLGRLEGTKVTAARRPMAAAVRPAAATSDVPLLRILAFQDSGVS